MIGGATLATAIAVGAVAFPLGGGATELHSHAQTESDASELEDLTLGELRQALADLGLRLSIESDDGPDDNDHFNDDEFNEDDFDQSGSSAETFPVDGDKIDLSQAESDEIRAEAQQVWDRFVDLIPANQRQMVSGFELDNSDGAGGYVYPDESDPTKWILGMAPSGLSQTDVDYVLIHEFAHLLTLQAKEVPPADGDTDPESCPTYFTGEGCALSGSLMSEFVQQFWPVEQQELIEQLTYDEDWDGLDRFYDEHRDDFVTDYATTNPAEDLAETFAHFVLEDRPDGDTIADQKVQMLWDDPTLVDLRDEIRSKL